MRWLVAFAAFLFLAGLAMMPAPFMQAEAINPSVAQAEIKTSSVRQTRSVRQVPSSRGEILLSYAPVVDQTAPAVVTVYARKRVVRRTRSLLNQFYPSAPNFFGIPRERMERALGSGVILDPKGFVITNYHVVRGGFQLTVALSDKTEFNADLVLVDEASDLAVLKINPQERVLPYLEIYDDAPMQAGDLVMAIGNPFGIGQTVTSGIISAPPRSRAGISDVGFFLQTDAAINQGNSGGALVTMEGKLAGVNTAIFTQGGGSIGVGFAIPATMVRLVLEAAQAGEPVIRRWIGADFETLTSRTAAALDLTRPVGVLVRTLWPDGPAQRAGLQEGDVIYRYNSHDTDDEAALNYRIATAPADKLTELYFYRGNETRSAEIIAEPPPEIPPRNAITLEGRHPLAGALASNLSPALSQELGLNLMIEGVVITGTQNGSRARRTGLRPGDILRELNGQPLPDTDALAKALESNANTWRVTIERNGNRVILVVR